MPLSLLKPFQPAQVAPLLLVLCLSAAAHSQSAGPTTSAKSPASSQPAKPKPAKPSKPHRQAFEPESLADVSNVRRVNLTQLDEALRESRGRSDKKIAKQLARLGLTERFSLARVAQAQSRLPGKRSRQALALLADASAFLPLPDTDLPALPRPTLADQSQMLSRAVSFVAVNLSHLPNFLATRITEQYKRMDPNGQNPSRVPDWSHFATHRETIFFRDGREVSNPQKHGAAVLHDVAHLDVNGTFGTILVIVFRDAAHGKIEWSHWEQGALGPVAVYRYRIAKAESHYDIKFESLTGARLRRILQHQPTAYHGEIGVDPSSGAILRLTLEADPDPTSPIRRSDIAVDYGLVPIGGRKYTVPLYSVAISRGWTIATGQDGQTEGYGDEISILNQVTFTDYHVFRSESRILTGKPAEPDKQ
ncbi:MAG: hypothetical protein WBD67_08010 [Terracidiphilus sp.]